MPHRAVIFSAPSGSGKTTLVRHLMAKYPELEFSVSACTRQPRGTEKDGLDYYFLTPEEFQKKIENGEFAEWEEVYKGSFYGTLKSEINRVWALGKNLAFDVDVKGGLNLKKFFGSRALSIFVKAPSMEILEQRLRARQTETPESLQRRLEKARHEMEFQSMFDVVIVNDHLQNSVNEASKMYEQFRDGRLSNE